MQLRQAEALGVLDDHDRRIGHVHADFNHRGGHQHIDLAALETAHDDFLFVRIEPPMQQPEAQPGKRAGAQFFMHVDG